MNIQPFSDIYKKLTSDVESELKFAWQQAHALYTDNQLTEYQVKDFFKIIKTIPKAKFKKLLPVDFHFQFEGQTKFKTNQLWLMARSQFFLKFIQNNSQATHHFSIESCHPDVFKVIKKFLKNERIDVTDPVILEKVIVKASEWNLNLLVGQLLDKYEVSRENYQYLYQIAVKNNSKELQDKILSFIKNYLNHETLFEIHSFCLENQYEDLKKRCEKFLLCNLNHYIDPHVASTGIKIYGNLESLISILKNFSSTIEQDVLLRLSLTQHIFIFQHIPSMTTFSFALYSEEEIKALVDADPCVQSLVPVGKNLKDFAISKKNPSYLEEKEDFQFLRAYGGMMQMLAFSQISMPYLSVFFSIIWRSKPSEEVLKKLSNERLISAPTIYDFKIAILLNLIDFTKNNNKNKLLVFLKRIFHFIPQHKFENYERIFENPLELLQKPLNYFLNKTSSLKDRLSNALRKYYNIVFYLFEFSEIIEHINERENRSEVLIAYKKTLSVKSKLTQFVFNNTILTNVQKKLLHKVIRNLLDFHKNYESYHLCERMFVQNIRESYVPFFIKEEVNDMVSFPQRGYQPDFIRKNRSFFKSLLPRIQESYEVIVSTGVTILQDLKRIKIMYLYFLFGDLEKLKRRLETEDNRFRCYERILFEEMDSFSKQLDEDGILVKKVALFLRDPANHDIKLHREACKELMASMTQKGLVIQAFLELPLKNAEQTLKDLFCVMSEEDLRLKASLRQKEKEVELSPEGPALEKEVETPVQMLILNNDLQTEIKEVTLGESFENIRRKLKFSLSNLSKNCRHHGSSEAIFNAHNHIEDLLCLMHRFIHQTEVLSVEQLYAFVIDCVRHGTLLTEQLLTALMLETNQAKEAEDLNAVLTHNLYSILIHCKFPKGPLPANIRSWIRETNRGDILVRDASKWSEENTFVQGLLNRVRGCAQGDSSVNPHVVIQDVFTYLRRIGKISEHLHRQFAGTKKISEHEDKENGFRDFSNHCAIFSKKLSQKPVKTTELESNCEHLKSIEQTLKNFESKLGFEFENVFQNLLPHLRAERESQKTMHPLDLHIHLGHVLLDNQMIVEEVLLNLIDDEAFLEEWQEHDLIALVKHLGMTRKNFTNHEWDFLNRGKATRKIVRYPRSYQAGKTVAGKGLFQFLQSTKVNSEREKFSHKLDLEEGYQIGDRKMAEVYAKTKTLALKDIEMLSQILNKVYKKQFEQS